MIQVQNNIIHHMIRKNNGGGGGSKSRQKAIIVNTPSVVYEYQYKLNEASGNALDSLGGLNLTAAGSPGSLAGRVGNARSFNGTTDGFSVNVSGNKLQGNNGTTLNPVCGSAWFNSNTGSGTRQIFGCRRLGSATAFISWIVRQEGANIVFYYGDNGGNFTNWTIGTIAQNTWQHVAFAIDYQASNSPIHIRVDGGSVITHTGITTTAINDPNGTLNVGGQALEMWSGSIDAVQLNTSSLWSDADLLTLYNSGNGLEF